MKFRDKLERLDLRPAPASGALDPTAAQASAEPVVAYEPEVLAREVVELLRARESSLAPTGSKLEKLGGLRAQLAALQLRTPRVAPRPMEVRPSRSFAEALLDDRDRVPPRRVDSRVPGERVETLQGPLYKTVVLHQADHKHGSAEVARAAGVLASEVALLALDGELASIDFSRALYIDTETTGLAGGSGTLPFLIGMAWFEGEQLWVEQLLLPGPGCEAPMLTRLAERLSQASAIVSYNGKSFDWPLLRTRFVLNRIPTPRLPGHLDLLHCARRVYKTRLGSVRLIHLEQELLGFERIDDLPGELIPQRYFDFLRGTADGGTLIPILDHNRSDLVALPALLGELVRRFSCDARQHACDQLGFARVAARGAERERALGLAQAVVENDGGEHAAQALYLVGELELKRGELASAVEAFERAAALTGCEQARARAHLALAKLHEHKLNQCQRALEHAARTAACEGEAASERRVARLRARLQRAANPRA
jgi:uncharacterized protein